MAKRKRVALIYTYSENWIGGTYYIENLVSALGQLPDAQQPELLIFSFDAADAERLQQAVQYPYWSFRRYERTLSLPERVVNKLTAVVLKRRFISLYYADVDVVFPLSVLWRHYFERIKHHLYWIPDFQEHYLPAFFKPEEIVSRKTEQQFIVDIAQDMVLSSYAAQNDFNAIYPASKLRQYVLQFAVTSQPALEENQVCLARYSITQPYFICSNQFWKHKDHPTVLRAVAEIRRNHPQILVVFTGKEHDYRNPDYYEELMVLRENLGLRDEVKFLGFIPRNDQLTLMQSAIAVIQPSLFEGWSTVVEDAKSLNAPLIVSALDVHKEQLLDYGAKLFFEPENEAELQQCMAQALAGQLPVQPFAYQKDILKFAQKFMDTVNQITIG